MIHENENNLTHQKISASDQRQRQLVDKANAGDTDAIEMIMMQYKGLVRKKAASMYMQGADQEDVIQEGMIGLYQAIRDYQPQHQVPFTAFASYCITARITDAVRRSSRLKHQPLNESISLQALQQPDDPQAQPMLALFADKGTPDPEKTLLERENLKALQYFIQYKLSQLERDVVLKFIQGTRYADIARQLDCPVKTVDNALRRARQKFTDFRRQTQAKTDLQAGAGQ